MRGSSDSASPTPGRPPRDPRLWDTGALPDNLESHVFAGLVPRDPYLDEPDSPPPTTGVVELAQKAFRNGLPLLMTGSLAAGVGVTGALPVTSSSPSPTGEHRSVTDHVAGVADALRQAVHPVSSSAMKALAPHLPDTYTVVAGDTASSIAERFGLPTAVVLGLNGLSWNTVLHEGQVLKLTTSASKQRGMAPPRLSHAGYVVEAGDTIFSVAMRLGVSPSSLLRANNLSESSVLYAGQIIAVPGTRVTTAHRVITAAPTAQIVLASSTTTVSEVTPVDEETAPEDGEASAESQDPLAIDILDAPELRRPATPPPPKSPPQAVTPPPKAPVPEAPRPAPAPPVSEPAPAAPARGPVSGAITPLNDERRQNARIIVDVGRSLGVPDYGIVIALATAMQESSLRNINWGDRDSLGLFQQRPSTGWGSAEQIMDPAYSTRLFFGGPENPNRGKTRGLLDISGWADMELTVAAQAVQKSGHPSAYAKWEASAWAWLDELS